MAHLRTAGKPGIMNRLMRPIFPVTLALAALSGGCGKKTKTEQAKPQPTASASAAAAKKTPATREISCSKIVADPDFKHQGAYLGDEFNETSISGFEHLVGRRKLTIASVNVTLESGPHFPIHQAETLAARNGALFIKLNPKESEWADALPAYLDGVISGKHDKGLREFARQAMDSGRPVFLSLGFGTSSKYVDAYRHIHRLVNETACNLTWVWNPSVGRGDLKPYYPGKEYVDWIAVSGFNSTDAGGKWKTFDELFEEPVSALSGFNHPILVEFASDENDKNETDKKSTFIRNALASIAGQGSRYSGFIYYHRNETRGGEEKKWQLSNDPQDAFFKTLIGYKRRFAREIKTAGKETRTFAIAPPGPVSVPSIQKGLSVLGEKFDDSGLVKREAKLENGTYVFYAGVREENLPIHMPEIVPQRVKNGGFEIDLGNFELEGRNTLRFEVKGLYVPYFPSLWVEYSSFYAEVYGNGKEPATKLEFELNKDWTEIRVRLDEKMENAQKIRFTMGIPERRIIIQVKDLRFE
jgi:hypothetical protein